MLRTSWKTNAKITPRMPFVHGVCTISSATNGITHGDFNEVRMLTTQWDDHSGIWRLWRKMSCVVCNFQVWLGKYGKKPLDAFKPSDDDKCGNLAVGFAQPLYNHAYNPQKWRFPLFKHQMEVFSYENMWKSSKHGDFVSWEIPLFQWR